MLIAIITSILIAFLKIKLVDKLTQNLGCNRAFPPSDLRVRPARLIIHYFFEILLFFLRLVRFVGQGQNLHMFL